MERRLQLHEIILYNDELDEFKRNCAINDDNLILRMKQGLYYHSYNERNPEFNNELKYYLTSEQLIISSLYDSIAKIALAFNITLEQNKDGRILIKYIK